MATRQRKPRSPEQKLADAEAKRQKRNASIVDPECRSCATLRDTCATLRDVVRDVCATLRDVETSRHVASASRRVASGVASDACQIARAPVDLCLDLSRSSRDHERKEGVSDLNGSGISRAHDATLARHDATLARRENVASASRTSLEEEFLPSPKESETRRKKRPSDAPLSEEQHRAEVARQLREVEEAQARGELPKQ
jgi:hypothetical protein